MLTYDERTETCYWQQENDEHWTVVMFSIENADLFYTDEQIQQELKADGR